MTKEELIIKIKEKILDILKKEKADPKEELEAIHSAALSITCVFGELMGEDPKAFAIDVLEQDIESIKQQI